MPFASSQTIGRDYRDYILPFVDTNIKHGAYELTVGRETVSTGKGRLERLEPGDYELRWPHGSSATIKPGQLAMLITAETVRVPHSKLAFISIRARAKLAGLINVSGFHVDPGFEGRLKFTVYNAGNIPVTVRHGERLFMIWFADFDDSVQDPYNGDHAGQLQIDSKDIAKFQGKLPSPQAVEKRVTRLEIILGFVVVLLIAILARSFITY